MRVPEQQPGRDRELRALQPPRDVARAGGHMLHRHLQRRHQQLVQAEQPRAAAGQRQQLRLRVGLSGLLQPWAEHICQRVGTLLDEARDLGAWQERI